MEGPVKGTVTPVASIFPPEEVQRAAKRVQDTISDSQKELDRLEEFIADNNNIVGLVQRLTDELHHDLMVPFGKVAFFPGRLIHTNEFMVLLGEGYYAERTSKQTVEILKRRGKLLESQIESLKAVMKDLEVEASFFNATASEAADGLVEIREDYNEEDSVEIREDYNEEDSIKRVSIKGPSVDNAKETVDDEQYELFMSRFDELEKQELDEGFTEPEGDEHYEANLGHLQSHNYLQSNLRSSEEHVSVSMSPLDKLKENTDTAAKEFLGKSNSQWDISAKSNSKVLPALQPQDEVSQSKNFAQSLNKTSSTEKSLMFPKVKENVQRMPASKHEAFTGSIVEHTHNLQMNPRGQTTTSSQFPGTQPSKPVSRFKTQRR